MNHVGLSDERKFANFLLLLFSFLIILAHSYASFATGP